MKGKAMLWMIAIVLLSSAALGANLNCSITTAGACTETIVLYLENSTGGYNHAQAQNITVATYANVICCDANAVGDTVTTDCSDATFLLLSNETNAHVQQTPVGYYPVPACISATAGDISCTYGASCAASQACLASMASSYPNNLTNAHLGNCSHYETKVCCGMNSPPTTPTPAVNSTDGSNESSQDLNCIETIEDPDNNAMNVTVRWYKNGALNRTDNFYNDYANGTLFNATLAAGNTTPGENWSCEIRLNDSELISGWGMSVNLTVKDDPSWENLTLPGGIYYIEPFVPPAAGNYLYNFSITFVNLTAQDGDILGCYVNQSDCYDDLQLGCNITFVNKTLSGPGANETITYALQPTDIVNTTLGGATSIWIPWRVDRCGVYRASDMAPKTEENVTWRIHVHGISWTSGDIANAVNGKSLKNQYLLNTIRTDNVGDISYSVGKYGGSFVELNCIDGIDDPDDPDAAIDCADGDCRGITHVCLAKQEFDNASDYYSPSGSHGTLAAVIEDGDIDTNTTSATTFNTGVQWTQHSMPNGTFKIRFRKWGFGTATLVTIIAEGFPNITSVNKYSTDNTSANGLLKYFNDNGDNPLETNYLNSTQTYTNKFVVKSFNNDQTVTNLDTTINMTFDNNTVNMSQGYIIQLTFNYVQGATPYSENMNITIFFDDPTYGASPRWNSTNEDEWDIQIDGATWGPCNDTLNGDFDYLNCAGNQANCFTQSSYDCYDPDCNLHEGTIARNAYAGTWTEGLCGYYNESQINDTCFDGYNNDWHLEDSTWGHANAALSIIDCRDDDCDQITNGSVFCEYRIELNCIDGFDNDMYQTYDCNYTTGSGYVNREYDCADYCHNNVDENETGAECDDGADNDYDLWYRTDWTPGASATAYAYNATSGAGMDCAWITQQPDEDCNLTIMGSGYICELAHELTCNDSFDNDDDNGYGEPDPGWTATAYNEYFGTWGLNFNASSDYDDYDCYNGTRRIVNESLNASWCFDGIDNDLDEWYWGGAAWVQNTSTGPDCYDPDCLFVTNPVNSSQTCLLQEYNATDPFFQALSEPDMYCENSLDDDADNGLGWPSGGTDCTDPDCNQRFGYCGACPSQENISWDSCADASDNDYDMPGSLTDCDDSDCYGWLGDYDHHICVAAENSLFLCTDGFDNDGDGSIDCQDAGCNAIGDCENVEADCTDDIDNDEDGSIDCRDSNCYADAACLTNPLMSQSYLPPTTSSDTWGGVTVTWDARVRIGTNYTVRFLYGGVFDDASLALGNLLGDGINIPSGLRAENFSSTGPNATLFETQAYINNSNLGRIELYDQDHFGTDITGFDITVTMETNDTLTYDSFEYSHSISGSPESGRTVDIRILDNESPTINEVITEPNNKSTLAYNGQIWVGVNVTDPENGEYNDGTIDRCYYNLTGPFAYSQSGSDTSDCKFDIGSIVDDGNYTLRIGARDDTGNYAYVNETNHTINLVPVYVASSFSLSEHWYSAGETISVSTQFDTDDAAVISNCSVYYKNSTGSAVYVTNLTASNAGDRVTCSGSFSAPTATEMYELWINITDAENDTMKSDSETFYVCSGDGNGTGTNGELWDCKYRDLNDDGTPDLCSGPTPPVLYLPSDGNITIHDRTPLFIWFNSTSAAALEVNYSIWVDNNSDFSSNEIIGVGIPEGSMLTNRTNYTNSTVLDLDSQYFWYVQACDENGKCTDSDTWNFTVESFAELTLRNATIQFGTLLPRAANDTLNWDPMPLLAENTGNIELDVNVTATDLWTATPNPTTNFQYMVYENETGSYQSALDWGWFNLNQSIYNTTVTQLNYSDANDAFAVHIRIYVPDGEPPTAHVANITFDAS